MPARPVVAVALAAVMLVPAVALAAGEATVVGKVAVAPDPVVPGRPAEVAVTLRAGARVTPPVELEVRAGSAVVGKLRDKPLEANQTRTFKIPISVPAGATGPLDLRVVGWGVELARVTASTPASGAPRAPVAVPSGPPAPTATPSTPPPPGAAVPRVPSVSQTVTTLQATLIGNRGTAPAPPPLPSVTQTVTTAQATLTGNRDTAPTPPPVPSVTQTVTTPQATLVGNR